MFPGSRPYLIFVCFHWPPTQTDPVFIGISRRELNVRPTAFFFIKCNLKSQEIQQLYSRAQDGYESTQLYTVSRVGAYLIFKNVELGFPSQTIKILFFPTFIKSSKLYLDVPQKVAGLLFWLNGGLLLFQTLP